MPDATRMKIGLIGTYDVNNYGDCLFPEVYAWLLRQHRPDCHISLHSPTAVAAGILSFDRVKALPGAPDAVHFDEDILILTGGETLIIGHGIGTYIGPLDEMSPLLRLWLAPLLAASQSATRFAAHSVGLPHANAELLEDMGRALEAADWMTPRDASSARRLGNRFHTAADPVFLIPQMLHAEEWAKLAEQALPPGMAAQSYLVAQISYPYVGGDLRGFCEALLKIAQEQDRDILLMPICHFLDDDLVLAKAKVILSELEPSWTERVHLLEGEPPNVKVTTAIIAASAGYVGTSLHGAVVAAAFAKPIACLGGAGGRESKQRATLERAGIDYGVVEAFRDLPVAFAASYTSDRDVASREAMERARKDFDAMMARLEQPRPASPPQLDPEVLRRLIAADRGKMTGLGLRLKRRALLLIRMAPGAYRLYRRRRLAKALDAA